MSNTEQNNSGRIPHFEKTIESEDKFVGRVIHVKLDKVELEDGSEAAIWCVSSATRTRRYC